MAKANRTTSTARRATAAKHTPTAAKVRSINEALTPNIDSQCDDIQAWGWRVHAAGGLLAKLWDDAPPDRPGAEPQHQQQEAWAQVGFLADTLAELGATIAHEAEDVARLAHMSRARTATVDEMAKGGAQ
jgi:hypothetical protein